MIETFVQILTAILTLLTLGFILFRIAELFIGESLKLVAYATRRFRHGKSPRPGSKSRD